MNIETINGKRCLTNTIKYKSGKIVKRIINMHTGIPVDVIIIRKSTIQRAIDKQRAFNANAMAQM